MVSAKDEFESPAIVYRIISWYSIIFSIIFLFFNQKILTVNFAEPLYLVGYKLELSTKYVFNFKLISSCILDVQFSKKVLIMHDKKLQVL